MGLINGEIVEMAPEGDPHVAISVDAGDYLTTIFLLNDTGEDYEESDRSLAFPQLPLHELSNYIDPAKVIGQLSVVRELAKRVRQVLAEQTEE